MFSTANAIHLNTASTLCTLRTHLNELVELKTSRQWLHLMTLLSHNSLCKGVKSSAFIPWRAIESIVTSKIPRLGCNKRGGKTKEERLRFKWTHYMGYYNFPSLLVTPVSSIWNNHGGTRPVPHCPHDRVWGSLEHPLPPSVSGTSSGNAGRSSMRGSPGAPGFLIYLDLQYSHFYTSDHYSFPCS